MMLNDGRFTDVVVDVGDLVVQGSGRWQNFRKMRLRKRKQQMFFWVM